MNAISKMQFSTVQDVLKGNNFPQIEKGRFRDTSEPAGKVQVNVRDISINEINTLIRAGNNELLDVVPFIPPHIIDQYSSVEEHRVDLLGQVEKSIEFKKSAGEDVTFLNKVLENLKNIDGVHLPEKIDLIV